MCKLKLLHNYRYEILLTQRTEKNMFCLVTKLIILRNNRFDFLYDGHFRELQSRRGGVAYKIELSHPAIKLLISPKIEKVPLILTNLDIHTQIPP